MVRRVYLSLPEGVLLDKVALRLRFAGLEVHWLNERMEGISDYRTNMHKHSQEGKAALICGNTNYLPWLLTCSGMPDEL